MYNRRTDRQTDGHTWSTFGKPPRPSTRRHPVPIRNTDVWSRHVTHNTLAALRRAPHVFLCPKLLYDSFHSPPGCCHHITSHHCYCTVTVSITIITTITNISGHQPGSRCPEGADGRAQPVRRQLRGGRQNVRDGDSIRCIRLFQNVKAMRAVRK